MSTDPTHPAETVACSTCHGEPCDKCGGSGKQIEEHAPWAREVVGCGWCHGEPCPQCGRYNVPEFDGSGKSSASAHPVSEGDQFDGEDA